MPTERKAPPPLSADPLRDFLGEDRGTKAKFADKMGISPQVLNNWLVRGVPRARLPEIADAMGTTTDDYLRKCKGDSVEQPDHPGANDFKLLTELSLLWGAIPPHSKQAILTLARDYKRLADDYAGDVVRQRSGGNSLASSNAVRDAYGVPGNPDRRKGDRRG